VDRDSIIALCSRAYGEDMAPYFALLPEPVHVVARLDGAIVSHALWVTRWLQAGKGGLLRTAYVELVATDPTLQRRGLAAAVMERLVIEVAGFDLAALCPSDAGARLYESLGWRFWRGPLAIRRPGGSLLPTPDERVMVLPLARTPPLELDARLTAEWRPGELW
jgi:aminoglycoside 2'-N-acetyltransferase I